MRYECKLVRDLTYKGVLATCLEEALTALEESFCDLTDQQMQAFPIPGRNNIAWIVMHALDNLETFAFERQGRERVYSYEYRWELWDCRPDQRPKPGDAFPSRDEISQRLANVRKAVLEHLATQDDTRLQHRHMPEDHELKGFSPGHLYLRATFHMMPHIRQIWLLRGALGLTDGTRWPKLLRY